MCVCALSSTPKSLTDKGVCVCVALTLLHSQLAHTHSASQLRGWQREQHACGPLSLSLSVWQSSLWRSSLSSSLPACVSCRNPTERKSLVSFDAFVSAVHVWETLQTSLFPRSSFFCCLKVCLDLCLVYSSRCLRWLGQVLIGGGAGFMGNYGCWQLSVTLCESHPEKRWDQLKVCIHGRFVLVWCMHVFTGLAEHTPENLMNLQIWVTVCLLKRLHCTKCFSS